MLDYTLYNQAAILEIPRLTPAQRVAIIPNRKIAIKSTYSLVQHYTTRLDILRFVAICSIVWGHSLFGWENYQFKGLNYQIIQSAAIELGKIGTVIFFLISGFFLADKVDKYTVLGYLKYRLPTLILPWLCFLTLFVIIQLFHIVPVKDFTQHNISLLLSLFFKLFKAFIFHAAYWFIPISVLSACLLIALKRNLNSWWLGIVLLGITLFYSTNLYHGWISANHTKAFAGYVFFMWLGIQLKFHIAEFDKVLSNLSWTMIISSLFFFFLMSCYEGHALNIIKCVDAYASLRLSNWLLSIVVFLAVIKSTKMDWLEILKPQNHVYGVYLIHCILITELMPLFIVNSAANLPQAMLSQCFFFVCILASSYLLAFVIKSSPVKFITGNCTHLKPQQAYVCPSTLTTT